MKKGNKLMNTRGVISSIMVISLILPSVGGFVSYNVFGLTEHFAFPWVIIILTLADLGICFSNMGTRAKDKIYIVTSVIILFLNKVIYEYVGVFFTNTSIGWKIMCVACVVHIVISAIHLKKKD